MNKCYLRCKHLMTVQLHLSGGAINTPSRSATVLTLLGSQILQRSNLGRILFLAFRRTPAPSLPVRRCWLLPLPGPRLSGLPYRAEAVPLDGLHSQAVTSGGPANGDTQAASALPARQRHPHRPAGGVRRRHAG